MKNHLLAIQSMAGDRQDLLDYLEQLMPSIEGYETRVATGSPAIDSLLAEKIQRALLDQIQFNVCVDLRPLSFVQTVDLITVFGNALDNAIEAEQMLPGGADRIIYVKSSHFANMFVLRFSNRFAGQIRQQGGTLLTGKQDAAQHGIGLKSIARAVQRYGGSVQHRFDNAGGSFDLVLTFPLPEN